MQTNFRSPDTLKGLGIIVLLAVIVIGNVYVAATSLPIRVSAMIVLGLLALGLAATTLKGKIALEFFKESRLELRKVIWPTRQETVQTTLMIAGIVLLVALLLWGFDSFFAYLVGTV